MKIRFYYALAASIAFAVSLSAAAQQSTAPQASKSLGSLFSNANEDQLIEPEKAFQLKVSAKGGNTLLAELMPAKGYYLYRDKIKFSIKDGKDVTIGAVKLPQGETKVDQVFGKTEIYRNPVMAEIALNRSPATRRVTLTAAYQGCHEKLGVCYPPIETTVTLALQ